MIYQTGLNNNEIAKQLKDNGVSGKAPIYCDSAEPKTISELRGYGFKTVSAKKGKDSIMFGINLLKGYTINVDAGSKNLIKELEQYRWKVDKNGDSLNVPIDNYNHAIDALRYLVMHKFSKKGYGKYYVI